MKDDGTPETHLEEWLLDAGLGFTYATHTNRHLTAAQMETLAESNPNPDEKPLHDYIAREFVSHYDDTRERENDG